MFIQVHIFMNTVKEVCVTYAKICFMNEIHTVDKQPLIFLHFLCTYIWLYSILIDERFLKFTYPTTLIFYMQEKDSYMFRFFFAATFLKYVYLSRIELLH